MKSVLLDFEKELDALSTFLKATAAEEALHPMLKGLGDALTDQQKSEIDLILSAGTNKRRYSYALAIVTMYGALERFVESAVQRYIALVTQISGAYGRLPEGILKNHIRLSVDYLALVRDGKTRVDQSVETIIAGLASCTPTSLKYEVTWRAFATRLQNVNRERTRDTFRDLGVNLSQRRLEATPSAQAFLAEQGALPAQPRGDAEVQKLFSIVDEVVKARNSIAHGVAAIDQIDDIAILRSQIDEVVTYGRCLWEVLEQDAILHAIGCGNCAELQPVLAVFNKSIVCVEFAQGTIEVGNTICMVTGDVNAPIRHSSIQSIEIEKTSQSKVVGSAGTKIGMKVSFNASMERRYFLVPPNMVELLNS